MFPCRGSRGKRRGGGGWHVVHTCHDQALASCTSAPGCRPTPATAPSASPTGASVEWHTGLFGESTTTGEHAFSRVCTTAPHRLFSAWPENRQQLQSRGAAPLGSSPQPAQRVSSPCQLLGSQHLSAPFDPALSTTYGTTAALNAATDGDNLCWLPETAETSTVMIQDGLAAACSVMAHRKILAPAGMSMLLATAHRLRDEELSLQVLLCCSASTQVVFGRTAAWKAGVLPALTVRWLKGGAKSDRRVEAGDGSA